MRPPPARPGGAGACGTAVGVVSGLLRGGGRYPAGSPPGRSIPLCAAADCPGRRHGYVLWVTSTKAEVEAQAERAVGRVPPVLRALARNASRHHTLTLAAGLAFFGILSIGPAVGVGFGLLRLLVSADRANALVDLLQNSFPQQLGLGDLLDQMQDRAARYAGIGLVALLWPATTLASGWARALDAIAETDSTGGLRGLRGRVRGLLPGGILVAALLMLLGAVTFGTALAGGGGIVLLAAVAGGAVVLQFLFNLTIYRWLPEESRPLRALWRGAALATAGVVVATAGFALALSVGEGLSESYPPALTTAVVLGLWLYGANAALLLGAEYNALRRGQAA